MSELTQELMELAAQAFVNSYAVSVPIPSSPKLVLPANNFRWALTFCAGPASGGTGPPMWVGPVPGGNSAGGFIVISGNPVVLTYRQVMTLVQQAWYATGTQATVQSNLLLIEEVVLQQ